MAIDLTGIKNINEYYTNNYFSTIFEENSKDIINKWIEEKKETDDKTPFAKLRDIDKFYNRIRDKYLKSKDEKQNFNDIIILANKYLFASSFIEKNIEKYDEIILEDGTKVPLFYEVSKNNGAPLLYVFTSILNERGSDILQGNVFGYIEKEKESKKEIVNEIITIDNESLATYLFFDKAEAPRFILLIGINQIALLDRNKWNEKRYLSFDMDEIYKRREETTGHL